MKVNNIYVFAAILFIDVDLWTFAGFSPRYNINLFYFYGEIYGMDYIAHTK